MPMLLLLVTSIVRIQLYNTIYNSHTFLIKLLLYKNPQQSLVSVLPLRTEQCLKLIGTIGNNNVLLVVDVNNLKNGRKPEKLQKENQTGYAGEGKQSEGN